METDPEYLLLMRANKMLVAIQNEIQVCLAAAHVPCALADAPPLCARPLQQAQPRAQRAHPRRDGVREDGDASRQQPRIVRAVMHTNTPHAHAHAPTQDVSSIDLSDILPAAYITGVAISTAGSVGAELPEREMRVVADACNALIELDGTHGKILSFVESRILFLAPNLAKLLGTTITAKLIALAGGIVALARLPANIIQVCLHTFLPCTCAPHTRTHFPFVLPFTAQHARHSSHPPRRCSHSHRFSVRVPGSSRRATSCRRRRASSSSRRRVLLRASVCCFRAAARHALHCFCPSSLASLPLFHNTDNTTNSQQSTSRSFLVSSHISL